MPGYSILDPALSAIIAVQGGRQTMFSQTAEYALRAIVHLALNPDEPQTAAQIAAATKVPLPYLVKVLQSLGRSGLVRSQRGLHGGCMLEKSPDTMSVYEVVQAVDPIKRITSCPLGLEAHGSNLCPLHRRMDNVLAAMEESFRASTIGELVQEPTTSVPLCAFPVPLPAEPAASNGSGRQKRTRRAQAR